MADDPLIEASLEPLASCDAAFSCLLQLGGQSGGNEVGRVHGRNVVNGETLSISRLIELAGDLGIRAEHVRLDWQRLQSPGFGYPILALLRNTNVVVLTGCGRDGSAEVAVWDPLNPYEEILFVPRDDFERVWTGDALIITAPASHRAATSPTSDFCWVTSAGLELLGKTFVKGQNPKRLVRQREEAGIHSVAAPKIMPRSDRAIVPVMHGKPALARAEIADEQPPRDPADAARLPTPALSRRAPARRPSPLARCCIAAGVIVAAAGSGAFLLTNSVTDPVAAAIILAKDVWAVSPYSAKSKDKLVQNATARSVEIAPRIAAAPIPAAASATPTAMPGRAAPSAEPTAPPVEPARPSLVAVPTGRHVEPAAPSPTAAAGPSVEPAAPSLVAVAGPPVEPAAPSPAASVAPHIEPAPPSPAAPAARHVEPAAPSLAEVPAVPPVAPNLGSPSAPPGPATSAGDPDTKSAARAASTSGSRLSAEEMAGLLARGDTLLSVGDVASARLFYERAAGAGGGLAAIRLGETFDPLFLDRVHLSGVRSDPAAASFWYHRARDLGATEADVLLKALEVKSK